MYAGFHFCDRSTVNLRARRRKRIKKKLHKNKANINSYRSKEYETKREMSDVKMLITVEPMMYSYTLMIGR